MTTQERKQELKKFQSARWFLCHQHRSRENTARRPDRIMLLFMSNSEIDDGITEVGVSAFIYCERNQN